MTLAAAYHYAENGGAKPDEIELLDLIDRFGVPAIMGRQVLTANEIRRLNAADNVVRWYDDRRRSANWVEFEQSHPARSSYLHLAEKLAIELIPEFSQ